MNKNIGVICSVASFFVWLTVMLVIVVKLPIKQDTIIMLSWPTVPGIIGGMIFQKKDRKGEIRTLDI